MNVPVFPNSCTKVSGSSTIHFAFQDFMTDNFSKYCAIRFPVCNAFLCFLLPSTKPLIFWFCYGNTPLLIANSFLGRIRHKLLSQWNPQYSGLNKTDILHFNDFKIHFFLLLNNSKMGMCLIINSILALCHSLIGYVCPSSKDYIK